MPPISSRTFAITNVANRIVVHDGRRALQ